MRLSRAKLAPIVYGVIQSGLTTAVATAIATSQLASSTKLFLASWPAAWISSWIAMLPVVLFAAPVIQRLTLSILRLALHDEAGSPDAPRQPGSNG